VKERERAKERIMPILWERDECIFFSKKGNAGQIKEEYSEEGV
jgi:hypothetical protein